MNSARQPKISRATRIWLDCDTGHDDAFAILLAAKSPDVSLLGISTVFGNASLENTTYNTRAILKAIGREDVPVYPGASKPLQRQVAHAPDIHGASGLDGTHCLPEPTVPAKRTGAVQAMYDSLSNEPAGTAWLVAVGALTNVANLINEYPRLVDHLAGLSIMGGALGDGFTDAPMGTVHGEGKRFGNHTPFAEFNIYCDPEAAQAVFSNTKLASKTTLIPLDLTHQFLATSEVQMGLLFGYAESGPTEATMASATPVRRLFFEIVTYFAQTYAEVFGLRAGPPTHDPLAVAVIFRPDLFIYTVDPADTTDEHEYFEVDIVTEGAHGASDEIRNGNSQCGRTSVRSLPRGQPGVTIPRALDSRTLWSLIERCLSRVENAIQSSSHANEQQHGLHRPKLSPTRAVEQRKSTRSGAGVTSMVSPMKGPETTLSQLEIAENIPDVRTDSGAPGEHISTCKALNLDEQPLDLTRSGLEKDTQAGGVS